MNQFIVLVFLIVVVSLIVFFLLLLPSLVTIIKMLYYEKVKGTIVDKETEWVSIPDGSRKFSHYKYEFNYLGNIYQIEDKSHSWNNKLEKGSEVQIYIKKGNPNIYLYPNRVRDRYIYLMLGLLGFIPALVLLYIIFTI